MRDPGLTGAKEEAREVEVPGLANESSNTPIVAETDLVAEMSRENEDARQAQATRIRMAAMDSLREQYGEQPIPEKVMRVHGLVIPRDREGRRARARRERVLSAARALREADVPFTVRDLAAAVGDTGRQGTARIRHAIAELVRAGQWPPAKVGE